MGSLVNTLIRFVNMSARGKASASAFSQAVGVVVRTVRSLSGGIVGLISMALGPLGSALSDVAGFFANTIKNAIGFDLSISGLLDEAEKARQFFSELRDELAFYSSATGSTTNATNILMGATAKSLATHQALLQTFSSMVDAGADSDEFIKDMLPTLGEFELKTGLAGNQFGLLATKFQQMLSEKKGIGKDIKALQKAMIGTGLKGAQLEQTMQGLTEATEKLAFATNGASLDIKQLGVNYSSTVAVFKAFGISAQTTSNFINNLLDPENMEKNMLLMNKLSISYEEFNEMLNSGKGQDRFFDKILNNVGKVGREAANIEDAATRYRYLKDTLNLPPEIANKLMKVSPNKMQSELRKIKREMEEAEKKDKWRKDLKAKEEKYEEEMRFLRMQMVAPLVELIQENRTTIRNFMSAIKPVIQGLAEMLKTFMIPLDNWFNEFSVDLEKITSTFKNFSKEDKAKAISELIEKHVPAFFDAFSTAFKNLWYSEGMQDVIRPLGEAMGKIFKAAILYTKKIIMGDTITFSDAQKEVEENEKTDREEKWMGEDRDLNSFQRKIGADMGELSGGKISKLLEETEKRKKHAFTYDQKKMVEEKEEKLKQSNKKLKEDLEAYRIAKASGDEKLAEKLQKTIKENTFQNIENARDLEQTMEDYYAANNSMYQRNSDLNQNYEELRKRAEKRLSDELEIDVNEESIPKPSLPNANLSQASQKTADDIVKKIDTTNIKEIANMIMANPELKQYIGGIILTEAANKLNSLSSVLNSQKEKSDYLDAEIKKLNENVNNFEKNTTVGILTSWESKFFGKDEKSMLQTLLRIKTNLSDINVELKRKNSANAVSNDFNSIKNLGSSVTGKRSKLVENASKDSVKDMQVKKTLFLKSIADSTYDSAVILKYVGENLIFTDKGLAVNNNATAPTGFQLFKFGKNEAEGDSTIPIFGI